MRAMAEATRDVVREPDGSLTEYSDVSVAGDTVERLLIEVFGEHWAAISAGPVIDGAAYEIRFTGAPKLSMLDGYLTIDTGLWHFHLCVNDHRGPASDELARIRRVARAAFFRTEGGSCAPTVWGLRLWNGRAEQMITVLFPSPQTELWQDFRRRYAGG